MWNHDCKVERTVMMVEDDKECNWCGRELSDETSEFGKLGPNEFPDDELEDFLAEERLKTVDVKDNPDGSANVTMDMSIEDQGRLIRQGLTYIIKEMKISEDLSLEPNTFDEHVMELDLSVAETNALFHFGFISALKMGMRNQS